MTEISSCSPGGERGGQDFIGNRKRAMWRATKRIPDDIRVKEFLLNTSMRKMMNNLWQGMIYDTSPNPFWTLYKETK